MKPENRTANAQEMAKQRTRYLDGELTHDEFYLWLADSIGLTVDTVTSYIATLGRIRQSADPHLNDIPLSRWDRQDYLVRHMAYDMGLPWSLSDTVCCLKSVARRAAAALPPADGVHFDGLGRES